MRWVENERTALLLVALAAAVVYLNALGNGFVFDDLVAVTQNPIVSNPRLLLHAFATDYWRGTSTDLLYRPLTVLSFGLNHLVHGMHPFGFHLVNVALHVLVSLTLYRLLMRLFDRPLLALIASGLFAMHPIHTEAVASIVGRAELLMSWFTLMSVTYYLDARDAPSDRARRKFLACMLCVLFACLSKENGIVAPALILLAEITRSVRTGDWSAFRGARQTQAALAYVTLLAVACLYLMIRYMVLGNLTTSHEAADRVFTMRGLLIGFPWWLQFANALQYFARYLALLAFPLWLSSDYSFNQLPPHASVWHWDIGVGALALVLLIVTAVYCLRRATPVFFGITFFFVAFLPVSNVVIPIMTILAERVLYLPSVGFVVAVAWVAATLLGESYGRLGANLRPVAFGMRVAVGGWLAVILAFYCVRTVLRNRDWHDEVALFSSAVRVSPNCANAHNCLGDALADADRFEEALAAYERSLEIIPDHGVFHFRKGNTLMKWGRVDEAIESYRLALLHEPNLSDAADALCRIHAARGNLDEALFWGRMAVQIQPDRALFHYNFGYVLQQKGKTREATAEYRDAVRLNPAEPRFAFNLGLLLRDAGDLDGAFAQLERATELDPDNEKYWQVLGDVLLKKGAHAAAAIALEQFIRLSTNETMIAKAREILAQLRK